MFEETVVHVLVICSLSFAKNIRKSNKQSFRLLIYRVSVPVVLFFLQKTQPSRGRWRHCKNRCSIHIKHGIHFNKLAKMASSVLFRS